MTVLNQSVKNVIEALDRTGDGVISLSRFKVLLEEERAGKNRKGLVKWLEEQDAQSSVAPTDGEGAVNASVPEVEPVYAGPSPKTDASAPKTPDDRKTIRGGEYAISDLIAILSEKRDTIQRSRSCGVENIRVHLAGIKITVR